MPNWCFTSVLFKGKPENIKRLAHDIELATEWYHANPHFCNVRYLLHLCDFDTVSYLQRFSNPYDTPRFRGSAFDSGWQFDECDDGDLLYCANLEMAWYTDYDVLQIIAMNYGVEYSAHSEEPGCDIYTKCRYGDTIKQHDQDYDLDFFINPDCEQLEQAQEDTNYQLDLDYENGVKAGSTEEKYVMGKINEFNMDYNLHHMEEIPVPLIYGVYYHYIYGVIYEDEFNEKFNRYPGIDRFNIYNKI